MSLPTGLKAAVAALAGAMAPSALAGCSVDIGPLQHRTESYSVYGPLRTLVVNAHVGHVQITGGKSGQVRRYLLDAQLELGVILARGCRRLIPVLDGRRAASVTSRGACGTPCGGDSRRCSG